MTRPTKYPFADMAPGQVIRISYGYPDTATGTQRRVLSAAHQYRRLRDPNFIINTAREPGHVLVRRKP